MFHRSHRRAAVRRPRTTLLFTLLLATVVPLLAASAAAAAPGDTIWVRQYSSSSKGDAFLDVARGPGDVYYCAGITRATEERSALLLVKYKADGTKVWVRTWAPNAGGGAAAVSVEVSPDGDVVVAGTAGVAPPASAKGRDVVVLRFKPNGTREWLARYDGAAHKDDFAADLALDGKGFACVAGVTRGTTSGQDYLALGVSPEGKTKWIWTYIGPKGRDAATAVAADGGGNWYVTGLQPGWQRHAHGGDGQARPPGHQRLAQTPAVRRRPDRGRRPGLPADRRHPTPLPHRLRDVPHRRQGPAPGRGGRQHRGEDALGRG